MRVPGLENPAPRASMPLGPSDAASGERRGVVSGKPIRGTIRLANGVQATGAVLFLIARTPNQPGPPLAVKRLSVGPFPLAFEIGPDDEMIKGRPWDGPIALSARVDSDGDPLTRTESEAIAELAEPVEPGAEGVVLELAPGSK